MFKGIDFRDLYRRGSTSLTPRRLLVLIKALPPEAPLWAAIQAEEERSLKPTLEQIRERQRYYDQRAKEAASD